MSQADPHQRLDEELDELATQRRLLADSLAGDREPGDNADQADSLERGAELARLDERIADLHARLNNGGAPGGLALGTMAVLRHPDGSTETIEVAAVPAEGADTPVITPDSPIARALAGHSAGDTVTWDAPAGTTSARLVELRQP